MKPILIIVAIVIALGAVFWLASGSSADAKTAPAKRDTGIVNGIDVQLDAKVKQPLVVKLNQQRDSLKQLLAGGAVDPGAGKAQLESYDALAADVEAGKQELVTRGTSAKEVDDWLAANHWREVQDLAKSLRDQLAAQPPQ